MVPQIGLGGVSSPLRAPTSTCTKVRNLGRTPCERNDRADELAQWEKSNGPIARLRHGGGEGDSRFGAAEQGPLEANATTAKDVADEELTAASDALLLEANNITRNPTNSVGSENNNNSIDRLL